MAIFIILIIIAVVIFVSGIARNITAAKPTEEEIRYAPIILNPELTDYIRRHK